MSDGKHSSVEYIADFVPEIREKVLIIDPNGTDLWVGIIQQNDNGKFTVHYPDYQEDDEIIDIDSNRILKWTRTNSRIFHQQEMVRNQILQQEEEEEVEYYDSEDSGSSEPEYKPPSASPFEKEGKKKGSKSKKSKKIKEVYHPRPEGARSNPRRGGNRE